MENVTLIKHILLSLFSFVAHYLIVNLIPCAITNSSYVEEK